MKYVITGGCGFIGSTFVNHLRKCGVLPIDILVIDKLTYASNKDLIEPSIPLLVKDICDVTIDDIGEVDYIVNFAAESHVDNSISNGMPFIKANVEGTYNMLEVARKVTNLKKFVQISTDEVYGDMNSEGLDYSDEFAALAPSSYYSASKASADLLVISAARTYNLPILITRTCNNFGETQHKEKFLPTVYRSIMEGTSIPLYGDGLHIREWIWVEDNVNLIYKLMKSSKGVWNIGSGDSRSNKEIIEEIGKITKTDVHYTHVNDRMGHDKRYTVNCDKLYNYLKTYNLYSKDLSKFLTERFG